MKATDPAFSQSFATDSEGHMYTAAEKNPENSGMDIRTYLAGQAMQGIMAHSNMTFVDDDGRQTQVIKPKLIARFAVGLADALIEQLNKEQKGVSGMTGETNPDISYMIDEHGNHVKCFKGIPIKEEKK